MMDSDPSTPGMSDPTIAQRVELSEAHAYERLLRGAPLAMAERYGLSCRSVGSAVALMASGHRDSLILNRVIGLGVREPVGDDALQSIDLLYAAAGCNAYALEISPFAQPSNLPTTLRTKGFFPFKQTTMFYRRAEPIAPQACAFQIRRAQADEAPGFVDTCVGIFGLDEPVHGLLMATFSDPAWQHWLAVDGNAPIGVAITHLAGDVAWIGWVGTVPSHRGRGVQRALTAAQLRGASESGCTWVTLEAATGTTKRPSQSLRNYCRLGWTVAYNRGVFVHKA